MRYSKEHKAETRTRIVENASVRLREHGAASIGIAELMKEAGLTHGGFYAHFPSRDALIDEAFDHALQQTTGRWQRRAGRETKGERLAAIIDGYLTQDHRDDAGNGCALPSLGIEVSRASAETRKAFASTLDEMITVLAEQIPGRSPQTVRGEAIAIIATMMGSMILARAAGDGEFSEEILSAGRHAALRFGNAVDPCTNKAKAADSES